MTPNIKRIKAALPEGVSILRQATEAAGFDPREVLRNPTDEQTDRIIAAIMDMTTSGEVDRQRTRNMEIASHPDPHGDGGRYVSGHTWGDELGTEGDPSDHEPTL